jgi:hypothetical protein
VKKFAFAAIMIGGMSAVLFATPLGAKGGGGGGGFSGHHGGVFRSAVRPNIGPLARRGYPVPRNIGPLAGRYLAQHHRHHRRGNGGGYDYVYGYSDYANGDYPPYAVDQTIPQDMSDLYAPLPPAPPYVAHPVIRTVANSADVCSAQHVKVPATGGGETTVTILRC